MCGSKTASIQSEWSFGTCLFDEIIEALSLHLGQTVCVRLEFVARAVAALDGSEVDVACVIDFHEGAGPTAAKVRCVVRVDHSHLHLGG